VSPWFVINARDLPDAFAIPFARASVEVA